MQMNVLSGFLADCLALAWGCCCCSPSPSLMHCRCRLLVPWLQPPLLSTLTRWDGARATTPDSLIAGCKRCVDVTFVCVVRLVCRSSAMRTESVVTMWETVSIRGHFHLTPPTKWQRADLPRCDRPQRMTRCILDSLRPATTQQPVPKMRLELASQSYFWLVLTLEVQ